MSENPIASFIDSLETETIENDLQKRISDQEETINNLKATIDNYQMLLTETSSTLTREIDSHKKDIEIIGAHLVKAAREYEWCSTYDAKVEEINEFLTVKLPNRLARFRVTGKLTINFSMNRELDFDADDQIAKGYCYDMSFEDLADVVDIYSREFSEIETRRIG